MATLARALSILVVDDNRDGADALALFLRHNGHEVRLAYDGAHAIDRVRVHEYDAVFCDIGMPGRNGYDVAREARRLLGSRPLLVAVTAYDSPGVRQVAREAGFDHFITKPADSGEIDRLLQAYTAQLPRETAE